MALQIEGARGYLDMSEKQEGTTPKLRHLAEQIADAQAWLDSLS